MHHPPLPPGAGLSLPVAVAALLRPPELLRPRPNRHIGRRVEPLTGERRPPHPSQAPSRPGSRWSGPDAENPEILPGAFLWERTSSLRGLAPYGTHVQIYGTSMCGSWTGRGRLEWSTTGGGRDHHSGWSSFNKANLRTEMESVHDLVFFSSRRPPKMHDWSSAFFPARKVGAYAVTLHLESVCSRYCGSPRYSGRPVPGKAWSHCEVPEGGFPPGLPLCPLGTSLSSWLEFRGAPLSRWTQSSWSSCLLRQSSWPRSLPSNGSGNSRRFREAKSDLCSGQSTLTLSWDPGLDTCPRFPPRPSEIRWWTCKHCPQRRQIQP